MAKIGKNKVKFLTAPVRLGKGKNGRPAGFGISPMTSELAEQFAVMWRHGIPDNKACQVLGVPLKTFENWIRKDVLVMLRYNPNGSPAIPPLLLGFKGLRTQAKDNMEETYLMRLENLAKTAERIGDIKTAVKTHTWLMEKKMRNKYGSDAVIERPTRQTNVSVTYAG